MTLSFILSFFISFSPTSLIQMLYTSHPDWCLHVPGRPRQLGRNQMVLDLSRAEVRNYLFQALSGILGTYVYNKCYFCCFILFGVCRSFSSLSDHRILPLNS